MGNLQDYLPTSIKGKKALITGGTTGIGPAIAILLAAQGARILLFGRHEAELDDALEAIRAENPDYEPRGFIADIATEQGINTVFKQTDAHFDQLDILINNAAVAFDSITDVSCADYVHEAVKRMERQKSGHIINIGSISAVATKAGIREFNEALGKEVNELGIKVTLIEPRLVAERAEEQAAKISDGEMLKAEDIAISVLYCLSQPKRCDVITLQIRPHLQIT